MEAYPECYAFFRLPVGIVKLDGDICAWFSGEVVLVLRMV